MAFESPLGSCPVIAVCAKDDEIDDSIPGWQCVPEHCAFPARAKCPLPSPDALLCPATSAAEAEAARRSRARERRDKGAKGATAAAKE
mmetsp:Transcript_10786/g.30354  ORF Transcript_10786/g.30354 Transcript_10786/m.30354 type:complete len:88 (+) Transcript_10786:3060-3323(+)